LDTIDMYADVPLALGGHPERVDLEDLVQQGEHLVVGALQVQPEQPVGFQGQLDVGASELVLQAVREQQVSSHGFHGAKVARRRVIRARR
jgi:hypothetical protein